MIKNFTISFRMLTGAKFIALAAGLLLSMTATVPNVQAQIVYNETFDAVQGP
jgi:ABC-type transporter Mla subunit MlaD